MLLHRRQTGLQDDGVLNSRVARLWPNAHHAAIRSPHASHMSGRHTLARAQEAPPTIFPGCRWIDSRKTGSEGSRRDGGMAKRRWLRRNRCPLAPDRRRSQYPQQLVMCK